MKRSLRYAFKSAALMALALGTSTPASASMVATICNDINCTGGDDFIVTDNSAGDTVAVPGFISFSASAFGYLVLLNTSQSKPAVGSATAPQLDLNFTVTNTAANLGSIFLYLSDTDFVAGNSFLLALGGTNSNDSGSVVGRAWGGTNDTALSFSPGNLLAALGPFTAASFSGTANGPFNPTANPFSLTIGTTISRATPGTTTGDLNLQIRTLPEPATWALMLLGFGSIGVALRRKKAARALAA